MDPGSLGVFIPISAVVLGMSAGILKIWSGHAQEMARIRASKPAASESNSSTDIAALRQEIAQLRDTTTQYDMSVERALDELRHRMANLEAKVTDSPSSYRAEKYPAPFSESEQQPATRLTSGG